jgi:hypothetical protein
MYFDTSNMKPTYKSKARPFLPGSII